MVVAPEEVFKEGAIMSGNPNDPMEIKQDIINDYKELFGDDLVSIIMYGSAARRDFVPGRSDINLMIVLSDDAIDDIDKVFKTISKWRKKKVATPLFLTERYIESSTDVFPIEYLNFQKSHVLIFGKDVLENLTFQKDHVRLQCEREIKGKLLILRATFLTTEGKPRFLKEVISDSLQAFMAIFRALLFLMEKEIPKKDREVIESACASYNLDSKIYTQLLDMKQGKTKINSDEIKTLFKKYLKEVRALSRVIDELGG